MTELEAFFTRFLSRAINFKTRSTDFYFLLLVVLELLRNATPYGHGTL